MDGTRDGQLFDQDRAGCATGPCRNEGSVLLASPQGFTSLLCAECAQTVTDPTPQAPVSVLHVSRFGVVAWLVLALGALMLLSPGLRTAGLFAVTLGVLAVSYVVDRAAGRRHGY